MTVPWHLGPMASRLNPALIAGSERILMSGDRVRLCLSANAGVFRHYWWMTGVFAYPQIGLGVRLPWALHADVQLGVGYMHSFWRRERLALRDGEYTSTTDLGLPSLMVPLSVSLGYRGCASRPLAVAPFISTQWAVQGTFREEIPALTHFFVLVGARIDLGHAMWSGT